MEWGTLFSYTPNIRTVLSQLFLEIELGLELSIAVQRGISTFTSFGLFLETTSKSDVTFGHWIFKSMGYV